MINDIKNAKPEDMDEILNTVLTRYREIYTDWDIIVFTLYKKEDRDQQIDLTIRMLENLKQK